MNTSPPIFPFDASVQPASFPTGPGPGSGDDAFAEQLSAALAATTLATTMPVQHQTVSSGAKSDIHGVRVAQPDGEQSASPTLETEGKPIAGAAASPALVDAGSMIRTGTSDAEADSRMAGDVPPSGRGAGIAAPGGHGLVGQAGVDVAAGGMESEHAERAKLAKADPATSSSDRPSLEPVTAEAARRAGNLDVIRAGSFGQVRELAAGSWTPLQNMQHISEFGRHPSAQTAPAAQALTQLTVGISEKVREVSGPDQAIASRPSLTDPASRLHERSTPHLAGQASAVNLTDPVEAALLRNTAVTADIVGGHKAAPSERSQFAQLSGEAPIRLAEAHVRSDHGQTVAGRPDLAAATHRPSGDRRSEPAASTPTTSLLEPSPRFAETSAQVSASAVLKGHPASSPAVAVENASGLSVAALTAADNAAQTAGSDAGLIQGTAPDGAERLQLTSSLEGLARDVERLDFTANSNTIRPQTTTAHPSAGAQVALQIVRSLPDGADRLSVHLQPADLGSVDIQLTFDGTGRLTALIAAERPETLELLQRDARFLERSLGDSGLKLSSDGLSFTLKQDQQQQQQGQTFQQQAHAREAAFHTGRAYDGAADIESATQVRHVDGLRLLDIRT